MKKRVLLTVFLKSCVLLKTLFYSVFSKYSNCNKKAVCWKNGKCMKNSGLFWTWQNGVFGLFFEVFMVLWFGFCVSGKVAKVFKCLFFPFLGGFCGVGYSCAFGFGRFRCCCGSCFGFLLFRFCFCLFWCCFCFVVGVVLAFSFFGEGLRVRWPTGHLTWPQTLLMFSLFVYVFVFFSFLCFLLFFGGFKGRVRWPKKGHLT